MRQLWTPLCYSSGLYMEKHRELLKKGHNKYGHRSYFGWNITLAAASKSGLSKYFACSELTFFAFLTPHNIFSTIYDRYNTNATHQMIEQHKLNCTLCSNRNSNIIHTHTWERQSYVLSGRGYSIHTYNKLIVTCECELIWTLPVVIVTILVATCLGSQVGLTLEKWRWMSARTS